VTVSRRNTRDDCAAAPGARGGPAPLFRWSGAYVGFLADGRLYDRDGGYLGWCEVDGSVWHADGRSLGELVDGCYVLKSLRRCPPVRRTPRVPPLPASAPGPAGSRLARQPRPGWADALEGVAETPLPRDLEGRWIVDDACLELAAVAGFRWVGPGDAVYAGRWCLVDRLIELEIESGPLGPGQARLRVLAFDRSAGTLSLRRVDCRSLPFTLCREAAPDGSAVAQADAGNEGALLTRRVETTDA
jgi:hypothetical protein